MVFYFVGTRVWALGKRRGYLTPVQFFRERWGSDGLGLLIFVVQIALLVPYLLIGVMGGGSTLTQVTDGLVPGWVGGLVICAVVLAYVTYGGMRGTIWVNVFQTVRPADPGLHRLLGDREQAGRPRRGHAAGGGHQPGPADPGRAHQAAGSSSPTPASRFRRARSPTCSSTG